MKKILLSSLVIVGLVAGVVGATRAYFSDTETSTGNTFAAGTLDLKVDDVDDPAIVHVEVSNIVPGWSNIYKWELKNSGTVDGVVTIEIENLVEEENGEEEPEIEAEDFIFTPCGGSSQTVGMVSGELGYLMKAVPSKEQIYPSVEKSPGVPCGNSYMPNGGGLHYLSTIGPFELGRNTSEATLAPGETMEFWLRLSLDNNLRVWDGCGWHDIDDNVIQSDEVSFDVVFRLDQVVTP